MRRIVAVVVALTATAGTALAAVEPPRLMPDGVYARPSYTAVVPEPGTLRAGAANGDITPPFGGPSTGFYVIRHCASTGAEPIVRFDEVAREVSGDPTEAPYAASSCVGPKASPDTDLYAKTFPASFGRYGRLRANAFVLDDGDTKVALVSVDLPGFFGEMHQAVANRIARLGIPRENLLVSASHTHTGPGGYFQQNLGWAALGGDLYDPRIFEVITTGIVDAITRAHDALRPAKLASGSALVDGLNGNRRGSQWQLNPEASLGIDPRNAPRIGMIRIDGTDGRPIGAITNFSSHGTIGGTENLWLTGDDKGWVSRLVEDGIGGDAVVASLNGAQGDIGSAASDTGGWPGGGSDWGGTSGLLGTTHIFGQLAKMENAGRRQAPHQLALWASLADDLRADVSLDARLDTVCFCGQEVPDDPYDPFDRGTYDPPSDDPMRHRVTDIGIIGNENQPFPATVIPGQHRKSPLLVGPPPLSPKNVRIQVMRVGDVALATMPGEPTITMGRRIERSVKAALNGDAPDALVREVWTTGLANDHTAYFSTPQEYEGYQYEASWSMFGPQTGNEMKRRLVQLAEWMARGEPVAPCTLERACVENPDTSPLTAEPQPVAYDVGAGTAVRQPTDVERFEGTSFSWIGGSPSEELHQNDAFVVLHRVVGDTDVPVATDMDQVIPVKYRKRYGQHRYTALFDPTVDWPAGEYFFRVVGRRNDPVAPDIYSIDSAHFTVAPSTALSLVARGGGRFDIQHPVPDPFTNFRWRARHAATAVATGTLNGEPVTFTGSIVLAPGDTLSIPAGGIVDPYGNTNDAAFSIGYPT